MRHLLIVGICLTALSPCAADDAPPAVAESPAGFRERYPEAARLISAAHVIPNLDSGYVPQGIAWSEELQAVVMSYYDPGGKRPSMFTFIEHTTGNLLTSAHLFDDDRPVSGHVGGVAVHRGFLWTCFNGTLYRIRQPTREELTRTSELRVDATYPVDSQASCLSASSDALWVGEFATNYLFRMARHHRQAGHTAWVAGYDTDQNGQILAKTQYPVDGQDVLKPDRVIYLPQKTQGCTLPGDMVAISTSYGSDDSRLTFFASPLGQPGRPVALPGEHTSPGFVLTGPDRVRTIRLPPGAEDLEWTGTQLLIPFEAGATLYREQWRQLGGFIEDRYYALAAPCTFSPQGTVTQVTLSAQHSGWKLTELCVRKGQRLQITATGRITLQTDDLANYPYVNANGQSGELRDFEGVRAPNGCLLVRVGERVYQGGTDVTVAAETAGDVQLGILERGEVKNNDGAFDVRISVVP